jgi:3-mercaptopyruvate sulfurtransferase SseA
MDRKKTLILALAAAALTMGALWHSQRPVIIQEATMAEVRAEAARGGYRLINTGELAKLYQHPPANLLLVDTRQDWEYRSGHIKGALNFPMEPTWWSRWRAQHPLAALLGPDKNRLVVFY